MNRAFKGLIAILSLAVGSLWLNLAHAASFDCAKARTKVEKLICADPFISRLDSQLGKVYEEELAKANPEQKKRLVTEERDWLKNMRDLCTTQACLKQAYMQRLAELKAFDEAQSPKRKILGNYTAHSILLNPVVSVPVASECRALVANFNQFRDVPFVSNNPRLSPKYPQFRRLDWKPMAWNRKLAKRIYIGCTGKVCVKENDQVWHYWLKNTKALREAGKPLLWRAQVDLLGDGRHETLIRLTHNFSPDFIHGKMVPVPPPKPYSRYIDSSIYMLPSPYPKMAKTFNNGSGFGVGVYVTDIIHNFGDKGLPYLVLAWSREPAGIGVSTFKGAPGFSYTFYPLCNIRWIPSSGM